MGYVQPVPHRLQWVKVKGYIALTVKGLLIHSECKIVWQRSDGVRVIRLSRGQINRIAKQLGQKGHNSRAPSSWYVGVDPHGNLLFRPGDEGFGRFLSSSVQARMVAAVDKYLPEAMSMLEADPDFAPITTIAQLDVHADRLIAAARKREQEHLGDPYRDAFMTLVLLVRQLATAAANDCTTFDDPDPGLAEQLEQLAAKVLVIPRRRAVPDHPDLTYLVECLHCTEGLTLASKVFCRCVVQGAEPTLEETLSRQIRRLVVELRDARYAQARAEEKEASSLVYCQGHLDGRIRAETERDAGARALVSALAISDARLDQAEAARQMLFELATTSESDEVLVMFEHANGIAIDRDYWRSLRAAMITGDPTASMALRSLLWPNEIAGVTRG